jgi:hypothetical protein
MLATVAWQVLVGIRPSLDGGRVYIHIIWFAAWIGFLVEPYPFGLLTMIVSLEALTTGHPRRQHRRRTVQRIRPAMRLTEPATIAVPNTYDSRAWESTVRRIRRSRIVVSDT